MLAAAVVILLVNISTYWLPLWPIKYTLVFQAIQMTLMNFNSQNATVVLGNSDPRKFENFMAMNVIISVFSTMCVTFNGILMNIVFQDKKWQTRYILVAGIFCINILCIVFTKFFIHENMRVVAMITMILSVIYAFVFVVSFLWIIDSVQKENNNLTLDSEKQRLQFKSMFDSLQEGIVVLQRGKITFTNDLCSKVFTAVSEMKSFGNNI